VLDAPELRMKKSGICIMTFDSITRYSSTPHLQKTGVHEQRSAVFLFNS